MFFRSWYGKQLCVKRNTAAVIVVSEANAVIELGGTVNPPPIEISAPDLGYNKDDEIEEGDEPEQAVTKEEAEEAAPVVKKEPFPWMNGSEEPVEEVEETTSVPSEEIENGEVLDEAEVAAEESAAAPTDGTEESTPAAEAEAETGEDAATPSEDTETSAVSEAGEVIPEETAPTNEAVPEETAGDETIAADAPAEEANPELSEPAETVPEETAIAGDESASDTLSDDSAPAPAGAHFRRTPRPRS